MKVLLVNFTDVGGGAAIACFRLAESLNKNGVEATMAVVEKKSASPFVVEIPKTKKSKLCVLFVRIVNLFMRMARKLFPRVVAAASFRTSNPILHSTGKKSLVDVNWINSFDCDVVNLHWIGFDMLSVKDIAKIKKPIVWTMHDTWPFCGAEHYPNVLENDFRYTQEYTRKNKPKTTRGPDVCRSTWELKRKYLSQKEMFFISPSNWEREEIQKSSLFSKKPCVTIPNIIPHSVFNVKEKKDIRRVLNIPDDKIVLGFGAAYDIDNPKGIKGSFLLLKALQELKNPEKYFFVVFGNVTEKFASKISIPFFSAGFISNENILALLYNACDVFICPSLVENLPNTCLESIFCGVPVVAFNSGGTSDIVVHKETGFLATPFNTKELADGVEWCSEHFAELSKNCVEKSVRDFDENKILKSYVSVYETLIKNANFCEKTYAL